jgi:Tfp pilus assembly protein PilF
MGGTSQKSVGPHKDKPPAWYNVRFRFALALVAAILTGACILYFPALTGQFIFDDLSLPLAAGPGYHPLTGWLSTNRPILILSYGLNGILLGDRPLSYHVVNLSIHAVNTCLVFLVLSRLLAMAGWMEKRKAIGASIGTLVFLIHPLQTESVSYISGRSESLASLFLLLAYVVFLYREGEAISWGRALAVLILFGIGVKTKESAVSLPGILFLTDVMWPRPFSWEGPRKNWRLYALMLPGAMVAAIGIFRMLTTAGTAGFSVATFTWYQYAFTEARAVFTYLQLAIFPVGQALDHDFPTSRSITQHGTLVYMALLAGLIWASVRWRRRYPLACFGFLMFLIFLAPTSSIVPIDDALVERRMYLPLVGLILIGSDLVERQKPSRPAVCGLVTAIALTFGGFCYARNRLWARPELLIALAAEDSQHNPRPLLNLAEVLIKHNRCDLALPYLRRAERILPRNYYVNVSWGRALACLGRAEEGMQHLQLAAQMQPCSQVYLWIGLVYGQMGRSDEAGTALHKAVQLDPSSGTAHGALALWYESIHNFSAAEREYSRNVALDPGDETARAGVARVTRMKDAQPPGNSFP